MLNNFNFLTKLNIANIDGNICDTKYFTSQ